MPDIIKKIRIKDVTKTNTFHPETEAAIVLRGNSNVDADLTALETAVENVAVYSIVKDQTAEAGYAATYHLTKDGVAEGASINIPKDFFVRSAEVKVCEVADQPIEGLVVGDKYIDFTININDGTAQDAQHIYIAVKDLFVPYTAGDGIAIEGTTIAAKVDGTSVYVNNDGALSATGKEYVAGDNITITEESGESGEMVNVIAAPDAWTKTNLVAGADISITQVQKPEIDSNTLLLFHFDNNFIDEISQSDYLDSKKTSTVFQQRTNFGGVLVSTAEDFYNTACLLKTPINIDARSNSYTIDYWIKATNFDKKRGLNLGKYSSPSAEVSFFSDSIYIGHMLAGLNGSDKTITFNSSSVLSEWTHVAFVSDLTNANKYIFVNGHLIESWPIVTEPYSYTLFDAITMSTLTSVDEVRISNIARWTEDFTPFSQPYAPAVGPAQYKIDCALDISGKLDKTEAASTYATQSAVTTGLAAKQDTLTAGQGIKIENNVISMDLSYTVLEESGESSES